MTGLKEIIESERPTAPAGAVGTGPEKPLSLDVIVCVHNSLEDVVLCLDSVARSLGAGQRLVIVDDGSDEPTARHCREFVASHPGSHLIRRPTGSGFTRAANAGLAESDADYRILLNSDVIVGRHWLEKIVRCGESLPDVGIIGPMSNAASWQSMPKTNDERGLAVNPLPPGMSVDDVDALCEQWAQGMPYPRVPLLNGFCFAIKGRVIAAIGALDEVLFPLGYGEENDFCFRATDAGFGLAVAIDTYVYHAKSKSYSPERRAELAKIGAAALRSRYGKVRIERSVQSMKQHPLLVEMRRKAEEYYAAVPQSGGV
jgi:GT2 family glycosyltransferase